MDENQLICDLYRKLPTKMLDGKEVLDFAASDIIPYVFGVIRYDDEILFLKRSQLVSTFKDCWHIVARYFDEIKPAEEKVLEEALEEAGYSRSDFAEISKKQNVLINSGKLKQLLIPFILVLKSKKDPRLNWESTDFKWVKTTELRELQNTVPGVVEFIPRILT